MPRYNLSAPATFKSYIDYIARAGVTFAYGEEGVKGLLPNIPVYVFISSGGLYADTPHDTMTPWVKQVLGFVGLTDTRIMHAEGVAMRAEDAMAKAKAKVKALWDEVRFS